MVAAYAVAKESLPAYAHRFSPKKFTQHQLFACLVLKSMLDLDYRSVAALLQDCGDLCRSIDLDRPPHFTTLQKAADRLLRQPFARRLHDETIHLAERRRILKRTIRLAAIDSSGFEARHTSRYFIRRRERGEKTRTNPLHQTTTYRRFPKASIVVDADSHLILAWTVTQGPSSDLVRFADLIHEACRRRTLRAAVLDAGYDAEWMHRYLRLDLGVRSIIPPKIGRPTNTVIQIDVLYLKSGYNPLPGEVLDHSKIDRLHEIKTSIEGAISADQKERLKAVMRGGPIHISQSDWRWSQSAGWHRNAKFSNVGKLLSMVGAAFVVYNFVRPEGVEWQLDEALRLFNSAARQTNEVEKKADTVLGLLAFQQYFANFMVDDTALAAVTLHRVYKILNDDWMY